MSAVLEDVEQGEMLVRNYLARLDGTGDTKTIWDPRNADEVAAAEETFNGLRKKGFLIYKVGADGEKSEAITKFDPKAGKLIAVPAVVGG